MLGGKILEKPENLVLRSFLVNRTLTNRYSTQINDETKNNLFKIIIEYIKSQSLSVAHELLSLSQSLCLSLLCYYPLDYYLL